MKVIRLSCALTLAFGVFALGSGAPVQAQPDLIIRTDVLEHNWVVRDEKLSPDACSVIEGGVTPGTHRLLRFTVTADNIGDADLHIGDPREHYNAGDGLFELAPCHQHFHFRNYALYELIDLRTGHVWKAAKKGFCMIDSDPVPASESGNPPRRPQYLACGTPTEAGNQGISRGWSDTYQFFIGGQYFVLDGGDGQPPVPPGDYIIRITANPPFRADRENPCRVLDPATGFCHNFLESSYSNNVSEIIITIPDHPGRNGFGPLSGSKVSEKEHAEH